MLQRPTRGQVCLTDFGKTIGHEQQGIRPAIVLNSIRYPSEKSQLIIVAPLTSTIRLMPFRINVSPPEGGLRVQSQILIDQIRAVSYGRLLAVWGQLGSATMLSVDESLRRLLQL